MYVLQDKRNPMKLDYYRMYETIGILERNQCEVQLNRNFPYVSLSQNSCVASEHRNRNFSVFYLNSCMIACNFNLVVFLFMCFEYVPTRALRNARIINQFHFALAPPNKRKVEEFQRIEILQVNFYEPFETNIRFLQIICNSYEMTCFI